MPTQYLQNIKIECCSSHYYEVSGFVYLAITMIGYFLSYILWFVFQLLYCGLIIYGPALSVSAGKNDDSHCKRIN